MIYCTGGKHANHYIMYVKRSDIPNDEGFVFYATTLIVTMYFLKNEIKNVLYGLQSLTSVVVIQPYDVCGGGVYLIQPYEIVIDMSDCSTADEQFFSHIMVKRRYL
jgi:hypothetical protein